MNLFYAAFIPGLQNFIEQVINERLSDVKIHKLLDGAVLFETDTSYDKLNFFCFNNIFACIDIAEESHTKAQRRGDHKGNILNEHINTAAEGIGNTSIIKNNSKNIQSFRIMVLNENVPAAIDDRLRTQTESYIARLSGLKVSRSLPDTEFWFLYRRDDNSKQNFSIFMKRLTLRSSWEKTLHKGELPPPLAWTLCRLAELKHSNVVLDPFCGYGSIPEAAFKYFHITNFIACDNDSEAAKYSTARFIKRKKNEFNFYRTDFAELPSLLNEKSIDVIVTDPPWGHFKENNEDDFLEKMFEAFDKLLKDSGRAVVLYANDENFVKAKPASFKLQEQIPILLSGKKAVIFTFKKNPLCLSALVP